MANQIEKSEPKVGQRIRELREQRGLTLRALAGLSGLSLNAISLIERGENSPTVSSLHLLAAALGVSITTFFAPQNELAVVFKRPEERLRTDDRGIILESLGIGLAQQQLESFILTIPAGSGNSDQPISHAGEEFIYCLEGEVEYRVGEQFYRLTAGCSLLFKATQTHSFANRGPELARLMMVFSSEANQHLARQLHLESHQPDNG